MRIPAVPYNMLTLEYELHSIYLFFCRDAKENLRNMFIVNCYNIEAK